MLCEDVRCEFNGMQTLVGVLNMRDVVGVLSGAATLGAVPPARGS